MFLAASLGVTLLVLFVVLPVVLAYVVARFVQSRAEPFPEEHRTSVILRDGEPAQGQLLDWRTPAQSFLDRHPMVTFRVAVSGDAPFEMSITQSVPQSVLRRLEKGMTVDVRLSADHLAGAIVLRDD